MSFRNYNNLLNWNCKGLESLSQGHPNFAQLRAALASCLEFRVASNWLLQSLSLTWSYSLWRSAQTKKGWNISGTYNHSRFFVRTVCVCLLKRHYGFLCSLSHSVSMSQSTRAWDLRFKLDSFHLSRKGSTYKTGTQVQSVPPIDFRGCTDVKYSLLEINSVDT